MNRNSDLRKILKISVLILLAFFVIVISGLYWLNSNKTRSVHENPDWELLFADLILNDVDEFEFEGYEAPENSYKLIPYEVFTDNDTLKKLPVEWVINKEEFESLDSVTMGIKNKSGSKMYFMTWGMPNSRVRTDLFVHREGRVDTFLFGGFGCATGIYLEPLKSGDSAIGKEINLLRRYPGMYEEIPVDSEFVELYRELYGDSVSIRFRLATYSLPWSKYESQMIKSDIFTVSTEKVIENWRLSQTAKEK